MSVCNPHLAIIWVIYGSNPTKRKQMAAWGRRLGAILQLIVNNEASSVQDDEICGSNMAYEFSGYAEGLAALPDSHEGPVLVVNDTLLVNHWGGGWAWLAHQLLRQRALLPVEAVLGDIRPAVYNVAELEKPFWASWFFWCTNQKAATMLKEEVIAITMADFPAMSPSYQAYLKAWLGGGSSWRGWHGGSSPEALNRKMDCIRWEHLLSAQMSKRQPLWSAGMLNRTAYLGIRLVDRMRTFGMRLAWKFKSR
ncbi:MAG: hypothetical protein C0424_11995 [Sphingobacteriaceae bacterium]|nr:hypothetical protein [Sphingobacteriaceae bacterium]